ncbi:MAG: Stp1/IreP family PP2C-type Ser/Thr phosphatase [Actinobacteria bacterium]|nr:MAG: Stp1/IreP family PP2C-type Ser/Thr phosphatase [Actinomycetota bacterium]
MPLGDVITIDVGAATDTGNIRGQNEDAHIAQQGLFAVADGMGGHNAGEVASAMAIEHLRGAALDGVASAEVFAQIIRDINSAIFSAATSTTNQRGMGTTLTAAVMLASTTENEMLSQIVVANVGDSRTYLLRSGEFRQLSVDHSYVQELVTEGLLTVDEARTHPRRNIVTRALGIDPNVSVDTWTLPLFDGDRFMLCSDGLVDEVPLDEIADTMREHIAPQDAAERLVSSAKRHGGRDNITVIILDVKAVSSEQIAPPVDLITPSKKSPSIRRRILAIALVVALSIGGFVAVRHQRSGYFVAFTNTSSSATIAIYKGQPDGLLWIGPTIVEVSTTRRLSMQSAFQREIDRVQQFETLEEARSYMKTFSAVVKANG